MTISVIIFVVAFLLVAFLASFFLNYYKMKKTPVVEDHDKIKKLSDQNFEHQIKNGVTLVDFWATWCMPCKMRPLSSTIYPKNLPETLLSENWM